MPSMIERINELVERKSLLRHPFYQMWSKGELSKEDLVRYSKEYFQLVKAVPELVQNLMKQATDFDILPAISSNLKEESEHIELWKRFAFSLDVAADELDSHRGLPDTIAAIDKLRSATNSSFEEAVATMYAYELEIPKISATKLSSLNQFYGLNSTDSRAYFEAHEEADVRHAALWRTILESSKDNESAEEAAEKSLDAQNELLDSVLKGYLPRQSK